MSDWDDDDLLKRCDLWMSAMLKGQKLLLVFFLGMLLTVVIFVASYIATGGK